MAWNADGSWKPEQDDVASRVNALTSQDSPLIQQARSSGMATANRRGLINSSIAAGAGEAAALGAAVPIASQDASQTHNKNLEYMGEQNQRQLTAAQLASNERTNAASIASADRANIAQTTASISRNYTDGIGSTLTNDKIPAATRSAAQTPRAPV